MDYFWYHRPGDGHPPPSVRWPHELDGSDRVAVACTQTDLPASRQRALVKEWCELLPTLEGVRLLWLSSRVSQALFDAACRVPGLEGLYVEWSGVRSLEALDEAGDLRYLHLGSSASVESLEPVSRRTRLRWLGLENLRRIRDLGPLEALTGLEGLAVEGSMWTTWHVETLTPIGRLHDLRFLAIANLKAGDGTLRPLFPLRKLRHFHAALWWDDDELEELRRLNPELGG